MGLPWLPSLLPRGAHAAASGPPRLVLIGQRQGSWGPHLHGDLSDKLPNKAPMSAGHEVAWGPIPSTTQGGKTVVTRILQANTTLLDQRMLSKLNVLRGFDGTNQRGHNSCAFGHSSNGEQLAPSIDQLVAWSPSYNRGGAPRERCINAGFGETFSFGHANPGTQSGPIDSIGNQGDPQKLFDRTFGAFTAPAPSGAPAGGPPARKPIVDAVLEDFKLLRDSNRRLSAEDRRRLDAHMEMLSELQRRVGSAPPLTGPACAKPTRTTKAYAYYRIKESGHPDTPPDQLRTPAESLELHRLYNDIIAAAFRCGISRVATISPYEKNDPFSTYKANWHDLSHAAGVDNSEAGIMAAAYQSVFEGVMLDLARKLDVEEANGQSYLDNSLIVWVNESAQYTHNQMDLKVITLGSAGGYFKTGLFVDYRNRSANSLVGTRAKSFPFYTGLLVHQWWANVLFALGIPRTEWDRYAFGKGTGKGYGPQWVNNSGSFYPLLPKHYASAVFDKAGEPLPIITVKS